MPSRVASSERRRVHLQLRSQPLPTRDVRYRAAPIALWMGYDHDDVRMEGGFEQPVGSLGRLSQADFHQCIAGRRQSGPAIRQQAWLWCPIQHDLVAEMKGGHRRRRPLQDLEDLGPLLHLVVDVGLKRRHRRVRGQDHIRHSGIGKRLQNSH